MNKLLIIYACTLVNGVTITEEQKSTDVTTQPKVETTHSFKNVTTAAADVISTDLFVENFGSTVEGKESFVTKTLVSTRTIETKSTLENSAVKEEYVVLETKELNEADLEINLGFDTSTYLPKDFDAYSVPNDIHSIDFIEDGEIALGFDTAPYLPKGFTPYAAYFNVHAIEFLTEEEELDVDTSMYLPEGFNPSENQIENIHSIDFMEDDTIELGFDTKAYLPEGFDPYSRAN